MNQHIISGFIKRAQEHGLSTGQSIDLWEKVAAQFPNMGVLGSEQNSLAAAKTTDLANQKAIQQTGRPMSSSVPVGPSPLKGLPKFVAGGVGQALHYAGDRLGAATSGIKNPLSSVSSSVGNSVGKSIMTAASPATPPSGPRGLARATDGVMSAFRTNMDTARGHALQGGLAGASAVSTPSSIPALEAMLPELRQMLGGVMGAGTQMQLPPRPADGVPTEPGEMGLLDETGAATKPPIQ